MHATLLHILRWLGGAHAEVDAQANPAVAAKAKENSKDSPDDAGLLALGVGAAGVVQATAIKKDLKSEALGALPLGRSLSSATIRRNQSIEFVLTTLRFRSSSVGINLGNYIHCCMDCVW